MEVGILSMRYAKAMIEYAQEKGVEDKHTVLLLLRPTGFA